MRKDLTYLSRSTADRDMYRVVMVPKYKKVKGKKVEKGKRRTLEPNSELAGIQEFLVKCLEREGIGLHPATHAYRKGRSIITKAKKHLRRKRVLRIDLEAFFDTVTPRHVLEFLPPSTSTTLKKALENWCFLDGVLPQGTPSAPFLSNIAGYKMDCQLQGLANHWRNPVSNPGVREKLRPQYWRSERINYTRYSDDLVFSSDYEHMNSIIVPVSRIVSACGFKVNPKKIRTAKNGSNRQYVTGIVVNDKLSTPKDFRKRLRAQLHSNILDVASGTCPPLHQLDEKGEVLPLNVEKPDYPFSSFEGKINFIKDVCPEQAEPLQERMVILREVHTLPTEQWSAGTAEYVKKCSNGWN